MFSQILIFSRLIPLPPVIRFGNKEKPPFHIFAPIPASVVVGLAVAVGGRLSIWRLPTFLPPFSNNRLLSEFDLQLQLRSLPSGFLPPLFLRVSFDSISRFTHLRVLTFFSQFIFSIFFLNLLLIFLITILVKMCMPSMGLFAAFLVPIGKLSTFGQTPFDSILFLAISTLD